MKILGLTFDYHDSSAALLEDGKVLGAVHEERFSRIKHDNSFPFVKPNTSTTTKTIFLYVLFI